MKIKETAYNIERSRFERIENIINSFKSGLIESKNTNDQSFVQFLENLNSTKQKNTRLHHVDWLFYHAQKVSQLAERLAKEITDDQIFIQQTKIVSFVHDIGKITINEAILNKSSPLTDLEWTEMKKHPQQGYYFLKQTRLFKEEEALIVKQHHERWDGRGYPNGLKKQEISLGARILSLADSFDAMTSLRIYRPILSEEEAIKEIKRCAGTQFDPELSEIFCQML